jgi:hypothetical protein
MRSLLLACALPLIGCLNETTTFPSGLEPLEPNTAPSQDMAPYQETLQVVTGASPDYNFAHGRGYVMADPGTVWSVLMDPEVVVDRRQTDSQTWQLDTEPQYEYSLKLSYTVNKILSVSWDEAWRYGTITGTPAAPELAIIRYQKVWGSTFIRLLEGSITILPTPDDPGVTEVQFVEHVNAVQSTTDNMKQSMIDRFNAIVARSHGQSIPPIM